MKQRFKALAMMMAMLILVASIPLLPVSATTVANTLVAQFSYSGGTAGTDIAGDKSGYAVSLGSATIHASVNGTDARKLEWTSDEYTYGKTTAVQPTMTAGSNNPWAVGAYIEVRLSTVGYTGIKFSADLGGTKKGPRDFKLQYSLDGVNYTDVSGATYSITTNKVMESAFDQVALPAAADNAQTLYIRMTNTSDTLINGSTGLAGATGGETAVNGIVVTGTGTACYYPQGDVNKDYLVNTTDVRAILSVSVGRATFSDQQNLLADYDSDGVYPTTSDARAILSSVIGGKAFVYSAASNGASDVPTSSMTLITLQGTTATVEGSGASVSGDTVTITAGGDYKVVGTMTDGQLIVAADDTEDDVNITLSGVTMTCSDSSPIYVQSADNTTIILEAGTTNTLTDTANYTVDSEGEPAATIYSKDDLIFDGTGTLVINAKYKNGITSKDDLEIKNGVYNITAVNHGIRGKDSIVIQDGTFTINAGADGMQSDNDTDTTRGYITIDDGTFNITAANDGIQAETALTINGGSFTVTTGGGSSTSPSSSDTESYKGLKGTGSICIAGGSITLDCKDDAIHSNGDVTLAGGVISAATGDDGVHADGLLLVNDPAALTVTKSYEAIEGVNITVTGGTMRLNASDDGVNAAGGTDSNTGYWYVQNNLLYVVSESTNGYQWTLNTDISLDVNEQTYLVTDLNSTVAFDVVLDIETSDGSGSPAFSTDWYPSFGYSATDVSGGYLPATNASVTAALDLYGYFNWNGIPSDGQATVKQVMVKLAGKGSICLGALQLSNNDDIEYPSLTATGSVVTSGTTSTGVINLLNGVAHSNTSTSSGSSSSMQPGGMGGGVASETTGSMTMTGGYMAVYAAGDGIDINGNALMTGGTMIVHGPTDSGNGSLDFDGTFAINGGIFVAAGSSGMLQTPSTSSTQYILSMTSSSSRSGGTSFGILDASGNTIVAFKPTKTYQSVIVSTPSITKGTTYTAYYGGTCSGNETDGLYDGNYSGGTSLGSATVSSIVSSITSNSNSNRPTRP